MRSSHESLLTLRYSSHFSYGIATAVPSGRTEKSDASGIQSGLIAEVVALLSHAKQYASERKDVQPPPHFDPTVPKSGGDLLSAVVRLHDNLVECGLVVTAESVERIGLGIYDKKPIIDISVDMGTFDQVLIDEFKYNGVFMLCDEQSKYHRTGVELFG